MGLASGRPGCDGPLIFWSFRFPVVMGSMGGLVAVAAMILMVVAMILVRLVIVPMFSRP